MASLFICVGLFLIASISLTGYFLPSIIALSRKPVQLLPIFAVNALTGWSVVGWVACLIWALR